MLATHNLPGSGGARRRSAGRPRPGRTPATGRRGTKGGLISFRAEPAGTRARPAMSKSKSVAVGAEQEHSVGERLDAAAGGPEVERRAAALGGGAHAGLEGGPGPGADPRAPRPRPPQ